MKIGVVFTGQGAQKVGMGKDFYDGYDEVKVFFTRASEILGYDISKVIFEGPEEELRKTSVTQPAVFLVSYAIYEIFKKETEVESLISFFAGHSLGEYTAVTQAGVLDFEKTVEVVKRRGELMERVSGGGMSAVIGLDRDKIVKICSKYNVEAVNFNSPRQIVIAGRVEDLDRVEPELKNSGAKRVIRLKVSGAFHSSYMKGVQKEFSDFLDGIEFK
ncbi:MAG: malonyl CoA-acyl carrier protein transacylase, partial [Caldiserica bacterium]